MFTLLQGTLLNVVFWTYHRMRSFLIPAGLVALSSAIELTPDTWDDQVAGKTVFVKFFAPWCGHCKRMKPDWDRLMDEYASSDSVLIADVDCSGTAKPLCDKVGVKGFPTVKWGSPDDLQDYTGGREFDALNTFASELQPSCSVANLDVCTEAQQETIRILQEVSVEELNARVSAHTDQLTTAEKTFKDQVSELQSSYEQIKKAHDAVITELQGTDIGLVKSVLGSRTHNEL